MRPVNLYNTLTKKIDEFHPNVPGKINMYTCGPTVSFYITGNLLVILWKMFWKSICVMLDMM